MLMSLLTGTAPWPCPCCAYAHVRSLLPQGLVGPRAAASATDGRAAAGPVASTAPAPRLRFDGATVVDTRTGRLMQDVNVLIDAGRITEVSRRPPAADPATTALDARGLYLVPGYNDMHSHVLELANPAGSLALMLAEGVTGFRQMSGSPALLARRRAGTLPLGDEAPQLLQTPGDLITPFNAGSARDVAAEIRRQQQQGADFIKVGLIAPEVFGVALQEARRAGIPILGHLQEGTDALEASAGGFRSIEHLGPGSTVWICCSSDEAALRADSYRREFIKAPPFRIPAFLQRFLLKRLEKLLVNPAAFADRADVTRLGRAIDSFDADKGQRVAAAFVADGSWQCPTLVRLRTQQYADRPEYQQDPMLEYLPAAAIARWRQVTARFASLPEDLRQIYDRAYPRQQMLARLFATSGVRMIAGTDGGSYLGPGLTLEQEFKELAEAGIPVLAILQMATLNAAEYLGREATMGTIEPGRDADLVLLRSNPLQRVENLHDIAGVVRAGRFHSRQRLDAMKQCVARSRGFPERRELAALAGGGPAERIDGGGLPPTR